MYEVMKVLVTILVVGAILDVGGTIARIKYNRMLNECQQNLPRDQYCELVAVPRAETGE